MVFANQGVSQCIRSVSGLLMYPKIGKAPLLNTNRNEKMKINENRKMNFFDGDHILILLSGIEVIMKVYSD